MVRTRKRIKKRRYAFALFFVILIFAAGMLIGSILSQSRIDYLENEVYEHRLNFQSLQLQSLFLTSLLDQNQTANCQTLNYFLEQNLVAVAEAQNKVDQYTQESGEKIFFNYKREYNQAQINYWLLHLQVKNVCEPNQVAILYFYSHYTCANCKTQGTILDYLKNKFGQSMLLFWIDADLIDEPMINIMKRTYNVTELPTLVIEDEIYHGFIDSEELVITICNNIEHEYCVSESN